MSYKPKIFQLQQKCDLSILIQYTQREFLEYRVMVFRLKQLRSIISAHAHISDEQALARLGVEMDLRALNVATIDTSYEYSEIKSRIAQLSRSELVESNRQNSYRMLGLFQKRRSIERFILGSELESAVENAFDQERYGFRHLYDLLLPEAASPCDAVLHRDQYSKAMALIAEDVDARPVERAPALLIDLAACSYQVEKIGRLTASLENFLIDLAAEARNARVPLSFYCSGTSRLDLLLDAVESLITSEKIGRWHGFGVTIDAADRRSAAVISWLERLATVTGRRITLRLSNAPNEPEHPLLVAKPLRRTAASAAFKLTLAAHGTLIACLETTDPWLINDAMLVAGLRRDWEFLSPFGIAQILGKAHVRPLDRGVPWRILTPVPADHEALVRLLDRLLFHHS